MRETSYVSRNRTPLELTNCNINMPSTFKVEVVKQFIQTKVLNYQ